MSGFDLVDYVDVKERLRLFYARYPEGSVQFELVDVRDIGGKTVLIGRALAYRSPDDPRPGIGTAWELVPGTTPYTRGSELMNLETSCWGRAVGSLGIGLDRGIATMQEVAFARARQEKPVQRSKGPLPDDEWTTPPPEPEEPNPGREAVKAASRELGSFPTPSGHRRRGSENATPKQLETLDKWVRPLGYDGLDDFLAQEAQLILGDPVTRDQVTKAHAEVIFTALKAYKTEGRP